MNKFLKGALLGASFSFAIDKPVFSCYNLSIKGGLSMSKKKNEISSNSPDATIVSLEKITTSVCETCSTVIKSGEQKISNYTRYAESPNVTAEERMVMLNIIDNRERMEHDEKMAIIVIGGILLGILCFKHKTPIVIYKMPHLQKPLRSA